MTTNIPTMKDILCMLKKRLQHDKPVYTKRGIEILRIINQDKPKECSECKQEKKVKDFYKGRTLCKECFVKKYIKRKEKNAQDNKDTKPKDTKPEDKPKDTNPKKHKDTKPKVTIPKKQYQKTDNKTDKKTDKTKDKRTEYRQQLKKAIKEYDNLCGEIDNVIEIYFAGNKLKMIDKGCELFGITEDIHTICHLIEEIRNMLYVML